MYPLALIAVLLIDPVIAVVAVLLTVASMRLFWLWRVGIAMIFAALAHTFVLSLSPAVWRPEGLYFFAAIAAIPWSLITIGIQKIMQKMAI